MSKKFDELKRLLRELGNVTVAFSGGADSTFLLAAAHEVLGDNAIAVTVRDRVYKGSETDDAVLFAAARGIPCKVVDVDFETVPHFAENPKDRCYYCKKAVFTACLQNGGGTVLDGSNADDVNDYRPGERAAAELGVRSPLREAGLTKAEIRALSKEMGLPTWDKPAAACLASRIPYGDRITGEKLSQAERGETFLKELGFRQVRVRVHGDLARIEAEPSRRGDLLPHFDRLQEYFKSLGFTYVTVDAGGYRMGSLNEQL